MIGAPHRINYARRQQHRRLSTAAIAAIASGATVLLAVFVARAGALSVAGALVMFALGLALYPRHWLSLAERSGVGARSEDEVRRTLEPLRAEGWRLRHSLPWQGRGDIDSLAIAPTGVAFARRRRGHTTIAISLGCASRRRGCCGGIGGGVGAALPVLCVVHARRVPWVEQEVLVVSIDRLTLALRNAAGGVEARWCGR
jgi:hypothetical protein